MQHYKDHGSLANLELLKHFNTSLIHNRLSHALLFHGLNTAKSNQFLLDLSALLLCHDPENKPCRRCRSCQLMLIHGHPDLTEIKPEKKTSNIKIESIRDLNGSIYLSPQLGPHQVVMIKGAEKMNVAASNALLKLLEEPPNHVYFILQATHLNTMLPTVLSRCQIWRLEDSIHYWDLADWIATPPHDDPDLAQVIESMPQFLADLEMLVTQKNQVCTIAAKWVEYDLYALMVMLYWINASCIQRLLGGQLKPVVQCDALLSNLTLPLLFYQLDKLNHIMRQLNQGIAINALLTIEHFLLGYTA